jgi:ubiquinone biosynthesis protein
LLAGANIAEWISGLVPVETLVPEAHREWRPLLRDSFQFVFSRLSEERLRTKIQEQMELPGGTRPELRLIRLISKMPALQKLGQILARNRRLDRPLRQALSQLENGMCDVTLQEMRRILTQDLGPPLKRYGVRIGHAVYKEGSASAIVKFTWRKPHRERDHGAFKVLKPYVPHCFAEDMALLQALGEFLASREREYRFAVRDLNETVSEVRVLLEHELDFRREQATLGEALRLYRSSLGIRVPRVIEPLCSDRITAMTAENGVKVTDAFPKSPRRRKQIANQVIEALVAAPLFSREPSAVFHADPHAGNLLYDEANRELVILDWALTEHLSLPLRRHLLMLAVMMLMRNRAGVCEAICGLERRGRSSRPMIERRVRRFFASLPVDRAPGVLDGMVLLDELALQGVRFPAALFLFRKVLFTLDGVLHDIAGPEVRLDSVLAHQFLMRCAGSFGVFHEPFQVKDLLPVARALL